MTGRIGSGTIADDAVPVAEAVPAWFVATQDSWTTPEAPAVNPTLVPMVLPMKVLPFRKVPPVIVHEKVQPDCG